ncbi:hypothetical protein [Burkholderia pyrrocinia]|uniref:hypothetical protein n=1 Tax=Burkholderia pyrrocinia TaxID=60550 RepID=UPI002AAFC3DA|nr:hypothetical protein [Burkholderia pyrrocinia]
MPNDNVLTSDRITELYRESRYPSIGWAHRFARAIEREVLAAHPGQPEPRAEVTDPFRELLAALIDIYDDQRNNAPEERCYVEGAWS